MSETLVLRMPDAGRPATWLVVDAFGNRMGQQNVGSLAEAAVAARSRRVRVCVPGASTLLLHADLPTNNSRKIRQALPFALEDQVAEDVDHLHFAIGAHDLRGYPTVVVTQAQMRAWLAQLAAAGIAPAELVVDVLSLPVREHTLVLAPDGAQILMRFPDGSGMVADRALTPLLIAQQLAKLPESQACTHALVYAADEATQQETAALLAGLKLEITYSHQVAGAIGLMAGDVRASQAINLLQGSFGERIGAAQYWLRWRVAAILSAVLLAIFIADQALHEVRLRRQSAAQQAQISTLFHQALPGVTRMVDPRVQMQQRLSQLTGGGDSPGALLPMLASAGAALQAQHDIQLQGLSFHAGVLQLEIQAGSISSLDNLKAALAQNPTLRAQLDSVSSATGLATARLTLQTKVP